MEVREPSIPRHKTNLLKRQSGLPPEPYHLPRRKTIHAQYHSKGSQCLLEGSISIMKPWWEIARYKREDRRNMPLERLRNIRISQRRFSSRIHNRTAHQIMDTPCTLSAAFIKCGIHLLAAIRSSVTHLLLYLGKPIKTEKEDRNEEEQLKPFQRLKSHGLHPFHHSKAHPITSAYNISIVEWKSYK